MIRETIIIGGNNNCFIGSRCDHFLKEFDK